MFSTTTPSFATSYTTITGDPAVGPLVDFDHDQINQMSVYDVVCGLFVDEEAMDDMPYAMGQWHPDGAHFWGTSSATEGLNIVVTDWCDDHVYDIGVYTDAQLNEDMGDPLSYISLPITAVGAYLHSLLFQSGAERMRPAPTPLPAPQVDAARLAAEYIAAVRLNGPEAIANVAGLGQEYGSAYTAVQPNMMLDHIIDVAYEVDELCDNPIDIDHPATDAEQEERFERAKLAAHLAIQTFRLDLTGVAERLL